MRPGHLALREPTLWRYRDVLPVDDPEDRVSLGEGFTPLLPAPRLGAHVGLPKLFVKDESGNPTGSFKARGLAVAISMARVLGATDVCLPSAGNAGSALAAYAARGGLKAHVFVPEDIARLFLMETRGLRRTGRDRPWPDHRRGQGLRRACSGARLVRVRDPQGALPHRGQEDDGVRDRGADGLEAARRHPLPHRRRHRPHRHVEGLRGDGGHGFRGCEAPAPVRRSGGGLRPHREGVFGGARGSAAMAERPDPRPRPARAQGPRRLPHPAGPARDATGRGSRSRRPRSSRASRTELRTRGSSWRPKGARASPPSGS